MSKNAGAPRRKAARRPAARTVDVELAGAFEGWAITARVDFAARYLADLQSGSIERIITVLDGIVVSHNLPGSDGELASTMGDVDPYDGLLQIAGELFDRIGKLPNR